MRIIILVISLFFGIQLSAQKNCGFSTDVKDSIGTYRETKGYLMHEKVFGGKSTYIFFTLANEDGTPFLKVQKIEKSANFISANCFDQQSKVYIQLLNGKIITLVYGGEETCGNLVRQPNESLASRVITGNFLFLKGSIEDLKSSPIWQIRIRYATETIDFAIKKELVSELMNETFTPETYFTNYLHCIAD
ncbi:hypothetical protein [Flavobacterium sp. SM2513]|uniref:hypothetical protein n=1 Tax=Flavobacterium sp. SM2513 TaxID=3424766 RepID=UPI003D7FB2EF